MKEIKPQIRNNHEPFPYITLVLRTKPLLVQRESVYIKSADGASSWFA